MISREEDMSYHVSDYFISRIIDRFKEPGNVTEDFTKPYFRPVFHTIFPLLISIYGLLVISGTFMNIAMAYHILRFKLYRDPTYAFLINIIISDIIKCVFVLPMSLVVILIDNWIFGKFFCFFLPMMQDIPFHVSIMTFLLIAVDRYRMLSDPRKPRIPAFVCALGTLFFAVCIVLPYPIYTTYLDLESYLQFHFKGLGICVANLADDMQEYMRGLFIGTYATPLAIIAYFYVKASRKLQTPEAPLTIAMIEARRTDTYSRHESNASNDSANMRDTKRESIVPGESIGFPLDLYDVELDVGKEKRTQKYLIFMVSAFAICLCPLMILRLAKLALYETYENSGHFDITYTMFVWVAFLPTITTPGLYASWKMSRITKERVRGYFRFSNCHNVLSCTGRNCNNVVDRAGSARGSVRGNSIIRSTSNIPSPDSLSINNTQRLNLAL